MELRPAPATILATVAVAVYLRSLGNGFVYDDAVFVVDNPWIRDLRHLTEIFRSQSFAFAGKDSNYYRPLLLLAHAAIYLPFGPLPAAFHAVGVALHAVTTVGVFAMIRRILGGADPFPRAAFLAALVFAVHPVHVEAVAWISGLPDLAAGTFVVGAFLAYLVAAERHDASRGLHLAGAACFLIATSFKEPALVLPAIVAANDAARRSTSHPTRYWAWRYGGLAAAGTVYAILRATAVGGIAPHAAESTYAVVGALDLAGTAIWRYVSMVLVPHPLNAFQTLDSATGLPSWIALAAFPLAIVAAIARRSAAWTAALTLFWLPLVPAVAAPALLPGLDNPWAERYAYLPSAGLAVALGILFARAAAAVIVLFAILTVARIGVWRDDLTLWTDAVSKSPGAGVAQSALGYALFARGDVDGAIARYERGIALKPDHADSHLNLGVALATKGLHEAAVNSYAEAIRLQPRSALAHADLAVSLSMLGIHERAIEEARRAVALQPELGRARHALGVALGNAGREAEAVAEFRRAIALDPADVQSRANLAYAEERVRRKAPE